MLSSSPQPPSEPAHPEDANPWLIGFINRQLPWRWRIFTRAGFRHVFALRQDGASDTWVFTEWCTDRLYVHIVSRSTAESLMAWARSDGALLAMQPQTNGPPAFPRMPLFCVTWIKHLLGLRHCLAITPFQLHRALLRRGAGTVPQPLPEKEMPHGRNQRTIVPNDRKQRCQQRPSGNGPGENP